MFIAYFIDQRIGMKKGENRSPLFGAYVIISNSMVPTINVQDAVVTMRVSEKNIKMSLTVRHTKVAIPAEIAKIPIFLAKTSSFSSKGVDFSSFELSTIL